MVETESELWKGNLDGVGDERSSLCAKPLHNPKKFHNDKRAAEGFLIKASQSRLKQPNVGQIRSLLWLENWMERKAESERAFLFPSIPSDWINFQLPRSTYLLWVWDLKIGKYFDYAHPVADAPQKPIDAKRLTHAMH